MLFLLALGIGTQEMPRRMPLLIALPLAENGGGVLSIDLLEACGTLIAEGVIREQRDGEAGRRGDGSQAAATNQAAAQVAQTLPIERHCRRTGVAPPERLD